jgi:hypothetical protein
MLATEAIPPGLRSLSDDQLGDLDGRGDDDTRAAVLAEAARRDRARARRRQHRAVKSEWYDAAYAQYLAAEAGCRGHLLSPLGKREGIQHAMVLWAGSEAWARKRASEELRGWWDAHGGRLSLATYRKQLATARWQARDERNLAAMTDAPEAPWEQVPGGAVKPVTVPIGSLTVAAYAAMDTAGAVTLHPSRDRAQQWLTPAQEPAPVPPASPPGSAVAPGAIARYTQALAALADFTDAIAARLNRGNHR